MKELSVVIVSYNTRDLLVDCLRSVVKETRGIDAEIRVVDNASRDGTCERVKREFPEVELTCNRENVGFGRANNQALQAATGELVLLLNPDATLTEGSLRTLLDFMRSHPDVGLVGPRLVYPDGRPQPSVFRFPRPVLDLFLLRLPWVRRLRRFSPCPERVQDADWLLGAALLCRAEALRRLRGFDERFFLFGEEKDLQLRMSRLGLRRVYLPSAVIVHHKAQSVGQDPARSLVQLYRSMDLFLEIHHGQPTRRLYRAAWIAGLGARLLGASLRTAVADGSAGVAPTTYAAALRSLWKESPS